MNDWRTILKVRTPSPQNTQNTQNAGSRGHFEDFEDIEHKELVRPLLHGDRITWEGADLTARYGLVDFVHTDGAGVVWAFVTLRDGDCKGWAAVNSKYAKKVDP